MSGLILLQRKELLHTVVRGAAEVSLLADGELRNTLVPTPDHLATKQHQLLKYTRLRKYLPLTNSADEGGSTVSRRVKLGTVKKSANVYSHGKDRHHVSVASSHMEMHRERS